MVSSPCTAMYAAFFAFQPDRLCVRPFSCARLSGRRPFPFSSPTRCGALTPE